MKGSNHGQINTLHDSTGGLHAWNDIITPVRVCNVKAENLTILVASTLAMKRPMVCPRFIGTPSNNGIEHFMHKSADKD